MKLKGSFPLLALTTTVMMLSACGKKKDSPAPEGAVPPPPPQQQNVPPGTQTPPLVDRNQPRPEPQIPQNGQRQIQRGHNVNPNVNRPQQPVPSNTVRPQTPQPQPQPQQPQPAINSQSYEEDVAPAPQPSYQGGKTLTGAQNQEGLFYTGSAPDQTMEVLKQIEGQLSPEQQNLNRQAAASIQDIQVHQDISSREAVATIKIQKPGANVEVYSVLGVLMDNLSSKLMTVKDAYGSVSTGRRKTNGQMQCLDVDTTTQSCANILISLNIGKSAVRILVRDSLADLHYQLNAASGNPEFSIIEDFLKNSAIDRETAHRIKTIRMKSYEVMNGRSGYEVQVFGGNQEFIGFRGELLSPEVGSSVNLPVQTTTPEILNDNSSAYRLDLQNSLGSIRLLSNDGQGRLKFKATTRPRGNFRLDQFNLIFTRQLNQVVQISAEPNP